MSLSDPIADMLNRIRNALHAGREAVDVPQSKIKAEIARILKREGYISDFVVESGNRKIRISLKYAGAGEPSIRGTRRHSVPGRRIYSGWQDIPRVLGGMGIAILSTPKGVLTDKEARKQQVGGEVLCSVW